MKIIYWINIVFILFCTSCDNRSAGEVYKEDFIAPAVEGMVKKTELWKGGLLVIYFKENNDIAQVINNHDILQKIKKGDSFKKKANSNKCLIQRGDSVFYFDCIKLKRLQIGTQETIGNVEEWKRDSIDYWIVK